MTTQRPHVNAHKDVFYKFVSDVAYMQAPVLGSGSYYVQRKQNESVTMQCLERMHQNGGPPAIVPDELTCAGYEDPAGCVDPLEMGIDHPMWEEGYERPGIPFGCSMHDFWSQPFLAARGKEDWPAMRKNTFLTFETNTITVASLVITPQVLKTRARPFFLSWPKDRIKIKSI